MKKVIYLVLLSVVLLSCGENKMKKELKGDYLGETIPNDSARLFAPGVVSLPYNVRDFALSPDGNEIFFTMRGVTGMTLLTLKRVNETWQGPEIASFSGLFDDLEPCFSTDGKKLFFVSNRPLEKEGEAKDYDIWITEKFNGSWSEPKNIGTPVSTDYNEFYPSVTENGRLYFCQKSDKEIGGEDIFFTDFIDGKYTEPKNAGENINTKSDEYNAFVARDESYIIYNTHGRGPGLGSGDMWISFKNEAGEFQPPVNMGDKVNTKYFEYCPYVTPDGKYFFFTSNMVPEISKKGLTYDKIITLMENPLNGTSNIYWISGDIIEELRVK